MVGSKGKPQENHFEGPLLSDKPKSPHSEGKPQSDDHTTLGKWEETQYWFRFACGTSDDDDGGGGGGGVMVMVMTMTTMMMMMMRMRMRMNHHASPTSPTGSSAPM